VVLRQEDHRLAAHERLLGAGEARRHPRGAERLGDVQTRAGIDAVRGPQLDGAGGRGPGDGWLQPRDEGRELVRRHRERRRHPRERVGVDTALERVEHPLLPGLRVADGDDGVRAELQRPLVAPQQGMRGVEP